MIFKQGQDVKGLEKFTRRECHVMAKRLHEDFIVETDGGWVQGRRGDWLVLMDDDLWSVVANSQFNRIYKPGPIARMRHGHKHDPC